MKIRQEPAYSFDDVLLVPQHSEIDSRADVDLSTRLGTIELKYPFIASNMDTVCGPDMAIAMGKYGGAGIMHRNEADEDIITNGCNVGNLGYPSIVSVGVNRNRESVDLIHQIMERGNLHAVCVDIAHGDSVKAFRTVECMRNHFDHLNIIAGNVATLGAASDLVNCGANIIKVGIGPGSVCTTRVVTGHGVPQLTAIMEVSQGLICHAGRKQREATVIADGGIRYPGDVVKALAAGAHTVMFGSLLAGTMESPGYVFVEQKHTYKSFRGSASYHAQRNQGIKPKVEGESAKVSFRGPVEWTLNNIRDGLRSGLSYSGCSNLEELRQKAEFVVVTTNSLRESHPHVPYVL